MIGGRGPFSAQIERAVAALLAGNNTWTGTNTFTGGTSYAGNVSPSVDNTYDLGATLLRWRAAYLGTTGLSSAGPVLFSTDNAVDIGAAGATRPRTGYFGTSIVAPTALLDAGTSSLPSHSFSGDTNTGMYASAADTLSFVADAAVSMRKPGGNRYFAFTYDGTGSQLQFINRANDATFFELAALTTKAMALGPTTGVTLRWATDGLLEVRNFANSAEATLQALRALTADGSAATPAWSFSSDADLGFYRSAGGPDFAFVSGGAAIRWTTGAYGFRLTSDSVFGWTPSNGTLAANDVGFSRLGAASVALGNGTGSNTTGTLTLAQVVTNTAASVIQSGVALTDGAGAGAGTITNAPAAGNPTKWIGINDNGTIRYVPAW